jgi:malate permease and related proteins
LEHIHFVFLQAAGLIALGYFLKHWNFIKLEDGKSLSKLLMHSTFPALMLVSTLKIPLKTDFLFITVLCMLYSGLMLGLAFFLFKDLPNKLRGVLTMGAGGFNVGLFGFPMIEGLFGKEALIYAIFYDIGNSLMIFAVVYGLGQYFAERNSAKDLITVFSILKKIFSLPPMQGMILGLSLNALSVKLPSPVMNILESLAGANKVFVLILMGIYLSFKLSKSHMLSILKVIGLRYSMMFIVFSLLMFSPLQGQEKQIVGILVLLPLGLTILPFSDEFGYDSELAGTLVNICLLISFLAMWLFMTGV